jgi:hypothetical protein
VLGTLLALRLTSTVEAAQQVSGSDTTNTPPAVAPTWLTQAQADRLNADAKAAESADVFTVFASTMGETAAMRAKGVTAAALMVKTALHRLYYAVDLTVLKHPSEDRLFYDALVEFERRAGLTVDGVFTLGEFDALSYFGKLADYVGSQTQPLASRRITHIVGSGYIHASGTWVIQGDQIADPINSSEIGCWKEWGNCISADASVPPPSRGDVTGPSYLKVNTSYWEITSWSETRVVAEQKSLCRRNVLTIDEKAQQAFQVQTDLNEKGCTDLIGALPVPRLSTLEDGWKVGLAHYKEARALLKTVSKFPFDQLEQSFSKDGVKP